MKNLTITVAHKQSGELRVCGAETGAYEYGHILEALARGMRSLNREFGTSGVSAFDIYEGMPANGTPLVALNPIPPEVLEDLEKLVKTPQK